MVSNNPPLDFQQNPVEFVMDALRVARAAKETWDKGSFTFVSGTPYDAFLLKVSPPFAIALMEDWLRLRAMVENLAQIVSDEAAQPRTDAATREWLNDQVKEARAALAKQGTSTRPKGEK